MKKVYLAEFQYCVYESDFRVISAHRTITGAYKAMKSHKLNEYSLETPYMRKNGKLEDWQKWRVRILEVKD